jgi:hypothetical protein
LLYESKHIELKWHIALLASRIQWQKGDLEVVWHQLIAWASDTRESKIVRVNSLESLYVLAKCREELKTELTSLAVRIRKEGIPSLIARIKKLEKSSSSRPKKIENRD